MSSSSTAWIIAIFVGLAGLAPVNVQAGPRQAPADKKAGGKKAGDKPTGAPARGIVDAGVAALAANDIPQATRLLEDAYRTTRRAEVLFQLGRVAQAAGRPIAAQDLFRRYLADPTREPNDDAVRIAEESLSHAMPPTGRVLIQSDPGALVIVDDRVAGTLPLPLPLSLSVETHNIVLEFPGKKLEAPVPVLSGRISELRMSRTSGAVLLSVLPAVLVHTEYAELPLPSQKLLFDALDQAVLGEQRTALGESAALARAPELEGCVSKDACRRQLAEKNKVDFLFVVRISAQGEPATYKIEATLLHVAVEDPAAQSKLECAACTPETAAARLKEATARLLADGLTRPRGQVQITALPAAAELRIGTRPPVASPYETSLWAGSYEVSARHPGHKSERRAFAITDGKKLELRLDLEKDLVAAPALKRPLRFENGARPKWRLALGGVFVGLGLGLTGLGAVGVVRDSSCVTPPELDGAMCPELYNTLGGGIAGMAVGAALTATGVALLALPGPRRQVEALKPWQSAPRLARAAP